MKVCYFIQTHKNPEQIYRLVRTLKRSSPSSQVLVGHDFTNCHLDMTPLQDLSDVHLLRRHVQGIRGDFSLIEPYLQAIAWLFEQNSDFDWLVYLSGQDYPVQPPARIEEFLRTTEYDGFICYDDIASKHPNTSFKRYYYQYYRLPEWTREVLRRLKQSPLRQKIPIQFQTSYGSLIGFPATSSPFNREFICYRGYQWHTLSRKCVQFIREFIDRNPEFIRYYKKTLVPDESLIQTILVNSQLFKLCNDDKRYLEFNPKSSHPRLLGRDDYPKMMNAEFHFARKFALEECPEILDMLDARIFQRV